MQFLVSIVVSIPACHAGDRGSIPRRGGNTAFLVAAVALCPAAWPPRALRVLPPPWGPAWPRPTPSTRAALQPEPFVVAGRSVARAERRPPWPPHGLARPQPDLAARPPSGAASVGSSLSPGTPAGGRPPCPPVVVGSGLAQRPVEKGFGQLAAGSCVPRVAPRG